MIRPTIARGLLSACLMILLLSLAIPAALAEDGRVWVRVHHPLDTPALQQVDQVQQLTDYGGFLWGQLGREDVEFLQKQGMTLTVDSTPFHVTLGGESFDPVELAAQRQSFTTDPGGAFYLVQFEGPIRAHWLADLRATGARVAQPLYPFSYFVWASEDQMASMRSIPAVRATLPVMTEWKLQPHLRELDATTRPTMALASAHVDERALREDLEGLGILHSITTLNRHFRVIHIDVAGSDYGRLASLGAIYTVQYIQQDAGPRGEMSNQSIVGGISGGTIQTGYLSWLNPTGLDGSGVTVGIVDGGVQEGHPDLTDNIVPCTGTEGSCAGATSSHGTHVAGAVAGTGVSGETDGNGFLRGQGVAPAASIVNQAYSPFLGAGPGGMVPEGMLSIYKDSAESGALLTNNSWGPTGSPQGYDIPTMEIDFISRDALPDTPGNQPVLAVWSIMNGGGDGAGACAPSSLGSPDEAKNLFGIGSTGLQTGSGAQVPIADVFSVSGNSAHGPACDGRRVPDIVAPGCSTDSTDSGSSYGLKCGTSMASPVVSGAISVWADGYIDETGVNPSPAMMKAVFIAAAEDLVGGTNADGGTLGHRPDRFQGYGRLDLDAVINPAGDEVYLMDQEFVFTSTGQDWGIGLNAADPSEPMKVVLTWTDAPGPGVGGTTPAWINDLDLQVDALDGNTYLGNVVGGDGWSATGGSPDGMNNTEAVWLQPSQHQGGFNLNVLATDIAGDALNPHDPDDPSQDFAIACYNCIVGDPTFAVSTSPGTLEACIPESGSADFDVDVGVNAIGAYSGTVALTTSGEPAGVSSVLNPDSVSVPGSAVWTVTVDDTAAAGDYPLLVEGDDGTDQDSADLALALDAYLAATPPLVAPADGAEDLPLAPTFDWDALPDVTDYTIQVATDAGFSSIVIDETVAATDFVPAADLALGTEYFWRVQGVNLCGGGDWSPVRSFTTRLEPEAELSATAFNFSVPSGWTDDSTLEIGNIGTGNLTFEITTDEPAAVAGGPAYDPAFDEPLDVPDFSVTGAAGGGPIVGFDIPGGVATQGTAVGFTFEGTVAGITGEGDWASDMRMVITSPEGASFDVGGFSSVVNDWDFQGSGSADDGTYTSTHVPAFGTEGTSDEGDWSLSFRHGWESASAGTMDWSAVTVTLHKTPPPYCGETQVSADWITVTPTSGSVPAGDSVATTIGVDTTGMAQGDYSAWVCVATNDPNAPMIPVEVNMTVTEPLDPEIFGDRFESSP